VSQAQEGTQADLAQRINHEPQVAIGDLRFLLGTESEMNMNSKELDVANVLLGVGIGLMLAAAIVMLHRGGV
jgi:hypothetical protein